MSSEADHEAVHGGGQRLGLQAAAEEWDRGAVADKLTKAAEERATLVERFPADQWPNVPLERYALGLGTEPEGFSYILEFGTPSAGSIKGGSAKKHLVYMKADSSGWYFQKEYGSEQEAWDRVSKGFAELVELASEERWDEIDQVEALWAAPAVRAKTVWMYFPDGLLPIYSEAHLDYFLKIFDIDPPKGSSVTKSHRLFTELSAMEAFHQWQPLEIMYFLYDWAHPKPGYEVVKIAPGEQASLWEDCLANGYIRVGWDELGDLTLYEDFDEIRAALDHRFPGRQQGTVTREARALDRLRSLEDGDIVVANQGTSLVLGIGRVDGGYKFRSDLADHNHTVSVSWFDTTPRKVSFGSAWMPTIVQIKQEQYHEILGTGGNGEVDKAIAPPPPVPPVHSEAERLLARTKQGIFYGPPGTGKTFSARRHAAWLLAGGSTEAEAARAFGSTKDLEVLERRFAAATQAKERPAWLVVANPQHWNWESLPEEGEVDFSVSKIKQNFDDLRQGDVVFGYSATPTKAVVITARVLRGKHTDAEGNQKILIGSGQLSEQRPTYAELKADAVLGPSQPIKHGMQGTLFRLEPEEAARLQTLVGASDEGPDATAAQLTRVTFHPTYTYEDFIEGYKPVESGRAGLELRLRDGVFKRVCRTAAANPGNQYVMLIDEINRGNVPKIFGELITLIEADKRGVTVTSLPTCRSSAP